MWTTHCLKPMGFLLHKPRVFAPLRSAQSRRSPNVVRPTISTGVNSGSSCPITVYTVHLYLVYFTCWRKAWFSHKFLSTTLYIQLSMFAYIQIITINISYCNNWFCGLNPSSKANGIATTVFQLHHPFLYYIVSVYRPFVNGIPVNVFWTLYHTEYTFTSLHYLISSTTLTIALSYTVAPYTPVVP